VNYSKFDALLTTLRQDLGHKSGGNGNNSQVDLSRDIGNR